MIADPARRGRALAEFHLVVAPRLFGSLLEAELIPADAGSIAHARAEWECVALHASVRGLVAASGFGPDTAQALNALYGRVFEDWLAESSDPERLRVRRERLAARDEEYGAIDREGGDLSLAAARHVGGRADPGAALAALVASLHDSLAEGAREAVRAES